ncbi:PriCT-2 domain-containing protein [Burkholderia cepacia]|uniref:phage/plasmid primase, P4 family n=1 Tax=Burkholderia cepacia TaxID=292 RepID=UPI00249EDA0D|nr:phage/plasmid primase, P4 family [Burkholderia cepacia]WGY68617.1 PriCT-2 domain-containing protein [Burkholderia cepacia]
MAVRQGLAVGIALNEFRDGIRRADRVTRINAFFVDLDGGVSLDTIDQFPIKPHIVTETSPDHFHVVWLVAGCPVEVYRHVQAFLAKKLGGDLNVTDVTRCMRLAGTINRKNGQNHVVRIVSVAQGEALKPIAFSEFKRAFGMKPKRRPISQKQTHIVETHDLEEVRGTLEKISAEDRPIWLTVGMALHSFMPNDQGKALWDQWSKTAPGKFDQAEQDRAWRNFKPNGGITKQTLFFYANQSSRGVKQVDVPTAEADLAKLFVSTYKGQVAFDHGTATWWVFDGLWKKAPHLALRHCKAMVEALIETVRGVRSEKQSGLLSSIQRQATASSLTSILRHASLDADMETSGSRFDINPDLLGVENGVIELVTGQHRCARPDDFITQRCGAAYDAEAKCPEFARFIDSITEGDKEFARYVQRALGYSAFGHTREQVFFLIIGPGGNGKGVLLRAITKALGDYGKTVAPNLLQRAYASNPNSPSPAVMALKGARLYACTEFDGQKRFDEAFVKQLSGSDVLTGRSNFGEQETFTPVGKLWLSLNSDPEIAYDNAAMWRRIRVIPLMRRFNGEDCDPDLDAKLANELPGILNWLIEGARQYHARKLGTCSKVTHTTEQLRTRSDTVRSWLSSCCTVRNGAPIQGANEVYRSYVAHTRNNGRAALPIAKFNAKLEQRGMHHVRRAAFNGWKGFVLKRD